MSNKNMARVKSHDARFKEAGGRIINTLRLKPDAAAALAELEVKGFGSPTAIINQLLLDRAVSPGFSSYQPRPWDRSGAEAGLLGERVAQNLMAAGALDAIERLRAAAENKKEDKDES